MPSFLLLFLWSVLWGGPARAVAAEPPTVLVVPKAESVRFWGEVRQGALKAGADLGVRVVYRGPMTLDDPRSQEAIVEQGLADGVDAVVIAPSHVAGMADVLGRARARGVKVVVIDSALQGVPVDSFIATDNRAAGREVADFLLKRVRPGDPILLLRHMEGNASTTAREQGFADRVADHGRDNALIRSEYLGVSQGNAYHHILALFRAHPEIRAVFAPSETITDACVQVLRDLNLEGRFPVAGFDLTPESRRALGDGVLAAVMVQQPYRMGYLGVSAACDALRGKSVPPRIVTRARLVTEAGDLDPQGE